MPELTVYVEMPANSLYQGAGPWTAASWPGITDGYSVWLIEVDESKIARFARPTPISKPVPAALTSS